MTCVCGGEAVTPEDLCDRCEREDLEYEDRRYLELWGPSWEMEDVLCF